MQARGYSEDQAHRVLRRMAMDAGQRLSDMAEHLLAQRSSNKHKL
jgi:AmiR/NasT family two-component response regulator